MFCCQSGIQLSVIRVEAIDSSSIVEVRGQDFAVGVRGNSSGVKVVTSQPYLKHQWPTTSRQSTVPTMRKADPKKIAGPSRKSMKNGFWSGSQGFVKQEKTRTERVMCCMKSDNRLSQ